METEVRKSYKGNRRTGNCVFFGLIAMVFTLNFNHPKPILMLTAIVLLFHGLSDLRTVHPKFQTAWVISCWIGAFSILYLCFQATLWLIFQVLFLIPIFFLMLALIKVYGSGIDELMNIKEEVQQSKGQTSAQSFELTFLTFFPIVFLARGNYVVCILFLIIDAPLLVKLYKVYRQVFSLREVKRPKQWRERLSFRLLFVYCSCLGAIIGLSYYYGTVDEAAYTVWTPTASEDRSALATKGISPDLLASLSDEDVQYMKDVKAYQSESWAFPNCNITQYYGKSEDMKKVYVIFYFQITNNETKGHYDFFEEVTLNQEVRYWHRNRRVLYDEHGQTYQMNYAYNAFTANRGEHHRGYVFDIYEHIEGTRYVGKAGIVYERGWFHYPYDANGLSHARFGSGDPFYIIHEVSKEFE